MSTKLTAPFSYFGGKRRIAAEVWRRFGRADVYSEPFAGSLAVLLGNPHTLPAKEVVSDTEGHICNVWRALAAAPREVAKHADWPTFHQDLNARHRWLRKWGEDNSRRLNEDPDYYDARAAGWWIWGMSSWIGHGWCTGKLYETVPSHYGVGVGKGVQKQRKKVPFRKIDDRLGPWFEMLSKRLENVIVFNDSWETAVGDSAMGATFKGKVKCVFIDPPYLMANRGKDTLYKADENENQMDNVARKAYEWAVENGSRYRIAYCCHKDDFPVPENWDSSTRSFVGYTTLKQENTISESDLIMFSPACLEKDTQTDLFS